MNQVRRLTICVLVGLGSAMTTFGCVCFSPGPPCQEFWKSDAVFSGKVISINPEAVAREHGQEMPPNRVVRFLVSESFRGKRSGEMVIVTEPGAGEGRCGFDFQIGEQYIVYAHTRTIDNRLWTSNCSRTAFLTKAHDDLNYLNGLATAKSGSTITGIIYSLRSTSDGTSRLPIQNVAVMVKGPHQKFKRVSDKKGEFTLRDLPPGKFTISIDLPKGLAAEPEKYEVELFEKGCASVNFYVSPRGG